MNGVWQSRIEFPIVSICTSVSVHHFYLCPQQIVKERERGEKTYTLCVCLWSEISYNLLTTRPKQPLVNNVTSINTVFKQGRFYPLNPLQKGDETGDLLKGPAQTRTSRQQERENLHIGPQFVTPGCDTALPSQDTAPGGCVIASSLPQGTRHTHSICLTIAPIAEFIQQCHNLSPDHLPGNGLFLLKQEPCLLAALSGLPRG